MTLVFGKNEVHCLKANTLKSKHGFFTREGGVSRGVYASLNTGYGSGDVVHYVDQNRKRVAQQLDIRHLCSVKQIHSAKVITVSEPWKQADAPEADAMVTTQPGIALGILTADCVPLLLADEQAGVVGAAHAGWKGALGGVVDNTIRSMQTLGAAPGNITAVMGPAIEQRSYQVDDDFFQNFKKKDSECERFFQKDPKEALHYRFDLKGYVAMRCQRMELKSIQIMPQDTYRLEESFFSYRRSCHREEPDYGRQISVISL